MVSLVVFTTIVSNVLPAQRVVRAGAPARVKLGPHVTLQGRVRSISADSLFLLSGAPGDPTDFAIAETRAWVVVDSMRMTVPLIVFGGAAVGGVAAGLVFVTQVIRGLGQLSNSLSCFAAGTTCPPDGGPTPAEEAALVRRVGYTAAAIGAVVGGIAGHQWHRVRWRRVRSGDWATVGVHPGGVGVQVSW